MMLDPTVLLLCMCHWGVLLLGPFVLDLRGGSYLWGGVFVSGMGCLSVPKARNSYANIH